MARGKYSPTVSAAYMVNQKWFAKYSKGECYDPDGFDCYGYDKNDVDRAGNRENDYLHNDALDDFGWDTELDYNRAYDAAFESWAFNCEKPVKIVK